MALVSGHGVIRREPAPPDGAGTQYDLPGATQERGGRSSQLPNREKESPAALPCDPRAGLGDGEARGGDVLPDGAEDSEGTGPSAGLSGVK